VTEVGEYSLVIIDDNNNTTIINFTIEDTISPTFDDIAPQTIEVGTTPIVWTDLIDNIYDVATVNLITKIESNTVNYSVIGNYTVSVSVEDESGNKTIKSFTVSVNDTTRPNIALISPIIVTHGKSFDLSDYIQAIDNFDGDISDKVTIKEDYKFSKAGVYQVELSVTDNAGNITELAVQVTVEANLIPYMIIGGIMLILLMGVILTRRFYRRSSC
jgi:PKD repeat protein